MSKQFTPGPWRMVSSIKGDNIHAWVFGKDPSSGMKRELQVLSINDYHPIKEHNQRRLADVRLISASPEMYDMLEAIVNGNFPDHEAVQQLLDKINSEK